MALVYRNVQKNNMSKRELCQRCTRAKVACLCHTITTVDNQLPIVILQHPSEVKHARGTAKIVELSLKHCEILVGEDFSDDCRFNALFNTTGSHKERLLLLYPSDTAISPAQFAQLIGDTNETDFSDYTVIVIDGSWKKAYKIFKLNPRLADITCIGIDVCNESNYRIRKSSRSDSLSTLEACHALLTQVEGDHFSSLLTSFDYMVDYQLRSMPAEVQARY